MATDWGQLALFVSASGTAISLVLSGILKILDYDDDDEKLLRKLRREDRQQEIIELQEKIRMRNEQRAKGNDSVNIMSLLPGEI